MRYFQAVFMSDQQVLTLLSGLLNYVANSDIQVVRLVESKYEAILSLVTTHVCISCH